MAKTTLPNNIEAEKAVIGACLVSPENLPDIVGSIELIDIFDGNVKNKLVYKAILQLTDRHLPIDIQTVTEELINMKDYEGAGGAEYLLELSQSPISLSNISHYIKIIKDQSVLRKLLVTMKDVQNEYENEEIEDISDFVALAEKRISSVAEQRRISSFLSSKELAERVRKSIDLQTSVTNQEGVTGVNVGYTRLNQITHGFQKGDMIIMAARPSVGKTALALNIAFNAALKSDIPVAFFSLEMPSDLLVKRLVANRSCVELDHIQTGFLNRKERLGISDALDEIGKTKLFIDDTPGIKLLDILTKARKLKANHDDLGLIVIDYIGLITSGKQKIESRQQEVSEISRQLKDLARELMVPVLVLCQLSRDVEKRDNKRPMLSDLRESGSIEQDADIVFLLYREDYYTATGAITKNINNKHGGQLTDDDKKVKSAEMQQRDLDKSMPGEASLVRVIIAKNRNGKIGEVPLLFSKAYGRFDSPSKEYEEALDKISKSPAYSRDE